MVPVECIARGYLAGLGLSEYQGKKSISGVTLPDGLVEGSRLPAPVFTPTTKAPVGEHDEFISYEQVAAEVGEELAAELKRLTLEVYTRGAAVAAARGIVVADTKLEFGRTGDGRLLLADEVLTPDSSRFWPLDEWEPGRPQFSFDKQLVRDWSVRSGWDKRPPGPEIPDDVVALTRARYIEAYERITGERY
jgi:phosphoribosylaminoimidazole-succinocarboxamide synthase